MNCTRCGRVVRHPVYWEGQAYGSTCARAIGASVPKIAAPTVGAQADERQQELFPSLWQRLKQRVAEILSVWGEPWVQL